MEKLKDLEEIYKKALIEKLKHPEKWVPFKDSFISLVDYMRIFCFSEENKLYFKVCKSPGVKTIYICEDKVYSTETISLVRYSFDLTIFDFKINRLLKKFHYYFKHLSEEQEIESKVNTLKNFLPKEVIRGFKINKIKHKL